MIWDKAQELGRQIGQSSEYQALRRAESSLREDKDTVAKLDQIQTLARQVDQAIAQGQMPDQATAEARKVSGVRQVVNDLQIVKGNAKAVARNDDQIEESIEDSIEARPALSDGRIDVEVKAGVARLSGTVKSRSDQVTAVTVARSTAGVKRVIDDLRLDTPPVSLR